MGKRKLRNCARCGNRHGPPTGKNCARAVTEEGVMTDLRETAPAETAAEKANGVEWENLSSGSGSTLPVLEDQGEAVMKESKKPIFSPGAFVDYNDYHNTADWEPDTARARSPSQTRKPRSQLKTKQQRASHPASEFENYMTDRMTTMENMLGRVAGIQQCQ